MENQNNAGVCLKYSKVPEKDISVLAKKRPDWCNLIHRVMSKKRLTENVTDDVNLCPKSVNNFFCMLHLEFEN